MNEQQQQIAQLEAAVKPLFTKEALARYNNIRLAYQEQAVRVLLIIAQLAQKQQITTVTDEQLKQLLMQLQPQKRETKIIR